MAEHFATQVHPPRQHLKGLQLRELRNQSADPFLPLALLKISGMGRKSVLDALTTSLDGAFGPHDLLALAKEFGSHHVSRATYDDAVDAIEKTERELTEAANLGLKTLSIAGDAYPANLRQIPDPPVVLFIRGSPTAIRSQAVAVVGTRKPTSFGEKAAHRIGERLADAGIVVVSGLALGCDTGAHEGSLSANGDTVAVLAHGLDSIQPKRNEALGHRILDAGGALVSEYPPGTPPRRSSFAERNRIQSGLSRIVIVIETGVSGGTMHTVRFAEKQGRSIACVDHPPEWRKAEQAEGNQKLIEEGRAVPLSDGSDLNRIIGQARRSPDELSQPGTAPSSEDQYDLWEP